MINRTDNVKGCGVSIDLTPLYPKEVLRRFGLSKSIEVSKKSQIGRTPPVVGALLVAAWKESQLERNHRPNPDGLDSEALLGFNGRMTRPFEVQNSRLIEKSLNILFTGKWVIV